MWSAVWLFSVCIASSLWIVMANLLDFLQYKALTNLLNGFGERNVQSIAADLC